MLYGEKLGRSDSLVFFGATGDLAYKKIFPALHGLVRRGRLNVPIVGVARSEMTDQQLIDRARASIEEYGGGVIPGRTIKGVLPAGVSAPILPASALDVRLDYESVAAAGSALGSASLIVLDDSVGAVDAATRMIEFFRHESCGKCTPCREGCDWLFRILSKIERGDGQMRDIELLLSVSNNILGKTLCAFGDAAATPVLSTIKLFQAEYEAHVREGRCTVPAPWRANTREAVAH